MRRQVLYFFRALLPAGFCAAVIIAGVDTGSVGPGHALADSHLEAEVNSDARTVVIDMIDGVNFVPFEVRLRVGDTVEW